MEDQKLLWIVFSVVLFAVVVLASVLYFLKPAATEPAVAAAGGEEAAGFDTYEYVRGASPVLPVQERTNPVSDLEIVVGEADPKESGPAAAAPAEAASAAEPRPADLPKASPVAPAAPRGSARAAPAPRAASSSPAPAAAPAPKAAAAQPSQLYWIQTASFKSRSGAETMVGSLGEKGITGRIQVSDQSGQPFYRVRVGPYTSRQEAEKFLAWIKGVKGLEQSYISVVTRSDEQSR